MLQAFGQCPYEAISLHAAVSLHASNDAHHIQQVCTQRCPLYHQAMSVICINGSSCMQAEALHSCAAVHCAERTKFAWQQCAYMTTDLTPSISRKGSKAGWSVWAIPVLTSVVCVQSSWDLSSSCSPAGWLETQSASGGAATRTKPGSIWLDIALQFICSQNCSIPSDCRCFNIHGNSCGCMCKVCSASSSN